MTEDGMYYAHLLQGLEPNKEYEIRARFADGTTSSVPDIEPEFGDWTTMRTIPLSVFGVVTLVDTPFNAITHGDNTSQEYRSIENQLKNASDGVDGFLDLSIIEIENDNTTGLAKVHYEITVTNESLPAGNFTLEAPDFMDSYINNGANSSGFPYLLYENDAYTFGYFQESCSDFVKFMRRNMLLYNSQGQSMTYALPRSDESECVEVVVTLSGTEISNDGVVGKTQLQTNEIYGIDVEFFEKTLFGGLANQSLYNRRYNAPNGTDETQFLGSFFRSTDPLVSLTSITYTTSCDGLSITLNVPATEKAIKYEIIGDSGTVATIDEAEIDGSAFMRITVPSLTAGKNYTFQLRVTVRKHDGTNTTSADDPDIFVIPRPCTTCQTNSTGPVLCSCNDGYEGDGTTCNATATTSEPTAQPTTTQETTAEPTTTEQTTPRPTTTQETTVEPTTTQQTTPRPTTTQETTARPTTTQEAAARPTTTQETTAQPTTTEQTTPRPTTTQETTAQPTTTEQTTPRPTTTQETTDEPTTTQETTAQPTTTEQTTPRPTTTQETTAEPTTTQQTTARPTTTQETTAQPTTTEQTTPRPTTTQETTAEPTTTQQTTAQPTTTQETAARPTTTQETTAQPTTTEQTTPRPTTTQETTAQPTTTEQTTPQPTTTQETTAEPTTTQETTAQPTTTEQTTPRPTTTQETPAQPTTTPEPATQQSTVQITGPACFFESDPNSTLNLQQLAADEQVVQLNWTNITTATYYVITLECVGCEERAKIARTTSIGTSFTGLTAGQEYTACVIFDLCIGGQIQNKTECTTFYTVPPAVSNATADVAETEVNLSWQPSAGAIDYEVTIIRLFTTAARRILDRESVTVKGTSHSFSNLARRTRYSYSIRARNVAGYSAPYDGTFATASPSTTTSTISTRPKTSATRYSPSTSK